MKILIIIPIAKGIPRDELSYFSAKNIPLGTLVTVPLKGRSIKGVVVSEYPVREMKTNIKTSSYALRNITTVHHDQALPGALFVAGQKTATFFAQGVGPVLKTMIPDQLFNYYIANPILVSMPREITPDIQAIQVPTSERLSIYKTTVRENLAKNKSTMIIVPTIVHAEFFYKELESGISEKIFIVHGKKTKKHVTKTLPALFNASSPVVYITTAPFSSIVRSDWETVIIEESSSSYYRYTFNPVFDMRFFIETFLKQLNTRIIYADTLVDPAIRYRIEHHEIIDMRTTWHIARPEDFQLVDMKLKQDASKKSFSTFDPITEEIINDAILQKKSMVFLVARKGFAPLTSCSDCGSIVACPRCSTPLVLHKKQSSTERETRIYMCHTCMHTTEPIDHCVSCGGWKLTMLGISTGNVAGMLKKLFPDTPIFTCDGETTTTKTTVQKTITSWEKHPGSFLVTTPVALPYLTNIPIGCIVSLDSLLSLPIIDGGYQALRTAVLFLEKITHTAIIQTRLINHDVMSAIAGENIFEFMKQDLMYRKQLHYPPEKVLVKIITTVSRDQARQASDYLGQVFKEYEPDLLVKKSPKPESLTVTALIKIDTTVWSDPLSRIHELVLGLDRSFHREVNPDGVL